MKFSTLSSLLLFLLLVVLLGNFWVSPNEAFTGSESLSGPSPVRHVSRLKSAKARPPTPPTLFAFQNAAFSTTTMGAAAAAEATTTIAEQPLFSSLTPPPLFSSVNTTTAISTFNADGKSSNSNINENNDEITQQFIPRARNLIFTSAGDRSGLIQEQWLEGLKEGEVDLVVYFYGKQEEMYKKYKKIATYVQRSNGTKFDNFYEFYWSHLNNSVNSENGNNNNNNNNNNISFSLAVGYEYVAIFDDDITWRVHEMYFSAPFFRKMFDVCHAQQPWIAGPAWDTRALNQTSTQWRQTHMIKGAEFHYSNFIEMNTMIIRMDKLQLLMQTWPYKELAALGSDIWIIHSLGKDYPDKYLVIDSTPYINRKRQGAREIDLYKNTISRKKAWEAYVRKHKLAVSSRRVPMTYRIQYKGVRDPAVALPGRSPPHFEAINGVPGLQHPDRELLARYFTQANNAMLWGLDEATGLAVLNGVKRALVFDDASTAKVLKLPREFRRVRRDLRNNSSVPIYFVILDEPDAFDIYYVEGKSSLVAVAASFLHAASRGRSPNEFVVVLNRFRSRFRSLQNISQIAWVVDGAEVTNKRDKDDCAVLRRKDVSDSMLRTFLERHGSDK